MPWFESTERDAFAESLLSEIIGKDKYFRIYRIGAFNSAYSTAFKPYIILPKIDFPPDQLRVILLHEWKHIQDKDYLTEIIVNLICFVFWWNPMVYILRKNFRFAQELKADQFSMIDSDDFKHFIKGHLLVQETINAKHLLKSGAVKAFLGFENNFPDRLMVLALRGNSRYKRIFTNVCYSAVMVVVFLASYMFTVLPAFWVPVDDAPITEEFPLEYGMEIFRSEDNFILDNEDGTFSLFVNGNFVQFIDESSNMFHWFPIHQKE